MNSELIFKGMVFNGSLDLTEAKMVCVPSKPHYADVDICLKSDNCNIGVAGIENDSLSFEEKKKLGYEIVKRWNAADRVAELEHALTQALQLAQRDSDTFGGKRKDIVERIKEVL
jgi:hypothetical protein